MNTKKYVKYPETKKKLKEIAEKIRKNKIKIVYLNTELNRFEDAEIRLTLLKALNKCLNKRATLRNFYRHLHVAYCERRGTSREKIEKTWTPADKKKHTWIVKDLDEKIILQYKQQCK